MSDIEDLLRDAMRDATPAVPLAPWGELERRAPSRRRPRWVLRGLALGALTLVLGVALLFGGETNGSGPSPLERASAAVGDWPPNQILHMRTLMVSHFDQPDQLTETWQLTSPPYTQHVVNEFPAGGTGADRVESAIDANGFGQGFDFRTNEVIQTSDVHPDWRPTGVEQSTRDEIRGWLENSHATSLGESVVDGHHVLGFGAFGHDRLYVDAETYLPVLDQSFGFGTGDERRGYDHHYSWELLPATAQNRALLDVAAGHPGARVTTLSGDAWRAAEFDLGSLMKPLTVPGG
jgi:hypothetical protein